MKLTAAAFHLDADEKILVSHGIGQDAVYINDMPSSIGLVLSHEIPADDRIAFLRQLAAVAENLADDIAWRVDEAVSA